MAKFKFEQIDTSGAVVVTGTWTFDDFNLSGGLNDFSAQGFSDLGNSEDVLEFTHNGATVVGQLRENGITNGEPNTLLKLSEADARYAAASHSHTEADITDLGNYGDTTQTVSVTGAWTFDDFSLSGGLNDFSAQGFSDLGNSEDVLEFLYNGVTVVGQLRENGITNGEPNTLLKLSEADARYAAIGGAGNLWQAEGNTGLLSISNVENVITWGAFAINPNADVSVSGSDITINTAGTYKFTVTLATNNDNRTELFIRTYVDTGSGFVWDVPKTVSDYVSVDADQNTGAVTLIAAGALSAGDIVEFRGFGDSDGACNMLNDGTRLIIEGPYN